MRVKQRRRIGDRKNMWINNSPKLAKFDEKNINLYMQEDQCMPKRIKSKTLKSRLMTDFRILNAAREKQLIMYNGSSVSYSWLLIINHGDQKTVGDIFKLLKENECKLRILCSAKLSLIN